MLPCWSRTMMKTDEMTHDELVLSALKLSTRVICAKREVCTHPSCAGLLATLLATWQLLLQGIWTRASMRWWTSEFQKREELLTAYTSGRDMNSNRSVPVSFGVGSKVTRTCVAASVTSRKDEIYWTIRLCPVLSVSA